MVKKVEPHTGNRKRRDIVSFLLVLLLIFLLNVLASFVFKRFDLTSEKRYTLASSTIDMLKKLDDQVYLKVYLQGDFDPNFTRLRNETREILDEFRAWSGENLQYEFITPGEGLNKQQALELEKQLYDKGLVPEEIIHKGKEKTTQTIIWPGALVSFKGRETVWQIFRRQIGVPPEECLNNSVQELEYGLCNALRKLQQGKTREVTFLEGHHELDTLHQYQFMKALSEYYQVNRTRISQGLELSALKGSDALVVSKPDTALSDKEIFVIDQYIMRGGKVLWLIDPLQVNADSLRMRGYTLGLTRNLNLDEMLYKYGVRLNPVLVQDMQCASIPINTGFKRGEPKIEMFPWLYQPLVLPNSDHPIVKNLDLIRFEFLSTLDTVTSAKGIKKTILLKTSRYSRTVPAPARIFLGMVQMPVKESQFKEPYLPVACLLEGAFSSFVEYRLPSTLLNDSNFKYIDKGKSTKMIVVADGDVAANDYLRSTGEVYDLGYDRYTRQSFANKTFLLNCVNYLLDDEGMLQLRSREVKLRLLDKKKILNERRQWQVLNVMMPLIVLALFAWLFNFFRKRRYGTPAS
ncbi:MAG TPA: gliding motility-associated ABC transporter substrate-binding protein GldG [Bacteroidia bacterium]|nr:gliding motility-associated ABC transporter substrate-binding protein GldG [Bacteroidia bacterium]